MTQSGGNGNKPDVNPDDIRTYQPAYYTPENDEAEQIGWWESKLEDESDQEGKFVSELPPELDEPEPPTEN